MEGPSGAWQDGLRALLEKGTSAGGLGVWLDSHMDECGLGQGAYAAAHRASARPSSSLWPGAFRRLRDVLPIALPALPALANGLFGEDWLRARRRRERVAWTRLALGSLNYAYCVGGARRPLRADHTSRPSKVQRLVFEWAETLAIRLLQDASADT